MLVSTHGGQCNGSWGHPLVYLRVVQCAALWGRDPPKSLWAEIVGILDLSGSVMPQVMFI